MWSLVSSGFIIELLVSHDISIWLMLYNDADADDDYDDGDNNNDNDDENNNAADDGDNEIIIVVHLMIMIMIMSMVMIMIITITTIISMTMMITIITTTTTMIMTMTFIYIAHQYRASEWLYKTREHNMHRKHKIQQNCEFTHFMGHFLIFSNPDIFKVIWICNRINGIIWYLMIFLFD